MSILVTTLGMEAGPRKHVQKVIEGQEWSKIIIVCTPAAQNDFSCTKEILWVIIDAEQYLTRLKEQVKNGLRGSIGFGDVGINLMSGAGKEHMAVLAALLELGASIRLVALTPEGIKEI